MDVELLEEMGQLWGLRQLSGIKELKIRCSEARNLKSLKKLSLKSVSLNMDNVWCKDFATNWSGQEMAFLLGPFDDLPGCLVTDVMQTLRDMNMLHFRFLLPLITCNIETLDLSSLKNINKVLVAVRIRCKDRLRSLSLEQCKGLAMSPLKDTLASLSKLQVLNLRQVSIGDDVLATLGSNNELLRELYLCYNCNISNIGVRHLCIDDGHVGKCKKLVVLTLEFTAVDAEGLLMALENLPDLVVLDHQETGLAALSWHHTHPESVLQLKRLSFDLSALSTQEVKDVVHLCPNLQELDLLPIEETSITADINAFLHMQALTNFKSQTSIIPSIGWFLHLGHSVTNLNLIGINFNDQIDLTIIGKSCLNLVKLNIHQVLLTETEFEMEDNHFKLLEFVSLQQSDRQGGNLYRNLQCIFASEFLQSVELSHMQLTDDFVQSILEEAKVNRKILSKLRDIMLNMCDRITIQVIKSLVCFTPCLAKVSLNHCERITLADSMSLKTFIASNKRGTHVDWA